MSGLVAFWHFGRSGGTAWRSCYDRTVMDRALSILLRRIGDERSYAPADWPYDDANGRLQFDRGGPFGHAVRFNGGYIFGAVEREPFDGTLLELHGNAAVHPGGVGEIRGTASSGGRDLGRRRLGPICRQAASRSVRRTVRSAERDRPCFRHGSGELSSVHPRGVSVCPASRLGRGSRSATIPGSPWR